MSTPLLIPRNTLLCFNGKVEGPVNLTSVSLLRHHERVLTDASQQLTTCLKARLYLQHTTGSWWERTRWGSGTDLAHEKQRQGRAEVTACQGHPGGALSMAPLYSGHQERLGAQMMDLGTWGKLPNCSKSHSLTCNVGVVTLP